MGFFLLPALFFLQKKNTDHPNTSRCGNVRRSRSGRIFSPAVVIRIIRHVFSVFLQETLFFDKKNLCLEKKSVVSTFHMI